MKRLNIVKTGIVAPKNEHEWESEIPKAMRMRSPRIWNMAHVAVNRLLRDSQEYPKSIIVATALGALGETTNYLDGLFGDGFGSPRSFIASVHNSMAGKLALDFKIAGPNLTVCDGQNSFASALVNASVLSEKDYPVLLVAVDEKTEILNNLTPHLSGICQEYLNIEWEEAAVAFLLDYSNEIKEPYISASGPQPIYDLPPEEVYKKLASSLELNGISLLPLSETSDSFLKPAITAYRMIADSHKGNCAIGSFSPSARAVAFVNLCI